MRQRPASGAFFAGLLLLVLVGCTGQSVVGGPRPLDAGAPGTLDATVTCPTPLLACGGRCSDPRIDAMNCGRCGQACRAGEVCQSSACVPNCTASETLCPGGGGDAGTALRCVALQTDRAHCGACGNECGRDEVCAGGRCTFMCTGATTECPGSASGADGGAGRYCADLQSDRASCGACGNACLDGYGCQNGVCRIRCGELTVACPAPMTDAGPMGGGEVCVNTTNDVRHCGACNNVCPLGQFCVRGACATMCGSGLTECSGFCRDLQTDVAGCGACDNPCGSGERCVAGRCQVSCGGGLSTCAGVCRDLLSDPNNCGTCDTRCPSGQVCSMGRCQVSCGGDGLSTTMVACPDSATCVGGMCNSWVCMPGAATCAGASTRSVCSADGLTATDSPCLTPANGRSPTCTGAGVCGFTCIAGFGDCNGVAADGCEAPLVTASDCGSCGVTCSGTCTSGTCVAPGVAGTYGQDVQFSSTNLFLHDYLLGQQVVVSARGTFTTFGLFSQSDAGRAVMALYADAGGRPGTLVARTDAFTVTGGRQEVAPLSTPVLAAGTYWIMAGYERSHTGYVAPPREVATAYIILPFGSTVPTTFPTPTLYQENAVNYYIRTM